MPTHTIRLRGGWVTTTDAGRTIYSRSFGRPRTLDACERVWLVCDMLPGPADAVLNGHLIGSTTAPGPFEAEITPALNPRNEVQFAVASPDALGEVRLEIRSPEAGSDTG